MIRRAAIAPPTTNHSEHELADAREALAYWRSRSAQLPWHRRAARAEAREMTARWQQRVAHMSLEPWRLAAVAAPAAALLELRGLRRRAVVYRIARLALRRSAIARRLVLASAALGVGLLALVIVAAGLAAQ